MFSVLFRQQVRVALVPLHSHSQMHREKYLQVIWIAHWHRWPKISQWTKVSGIHRRTRPKLAQPVGHHNQWLLQLERTIVQWYVNIWFSGSNFNSITTNYYTHKIIHCFTISFDNICSFSLSLSLIFQLYWMSCT